MGVGYYKAITQWSKGEYSGANNTQDDFMVIGLNGAGPRTDEPSSELQSASPTSGVISSATDIDEFSLTVADGQTATIVAMAAPTSPDLDIVLSLSGPDGFITSNDPGSGSSSGDVATGNERFDRGGSCWDVHHQGRRCRLCQPSQPRVLRLRQRRRLHRRDHDHHCVGAALHRSRIWGGQLPQVCGKRCRCKTIDVPHKIRGERSARKYVV